MANSPIVIAHRGASAYLPEHTREAKVLAYGQGADFLEQDVVASRDGELVVLHDLHLDDVSNVADCFPGRAREDGCFYVIDFDVAELKQLNLCERRRPGTDQAQFPERFAALSHDFRIVTLAEEIELIHELNRGTGRRVGLYPEIKAPDWHQAHGVDLGRKLLDVLADFGYSNRADPVFVQCFEAAELSRLRPRSRLKFVRLMDAQGTSALDQAGLEAIRGYADALGPPYSGLMRANTLRKSLIADRIAQAGLMVHPYTFRRDQLPTGDFDFEALLRFFFREVRVDGLFCDHPDVALRVRAAMAAGP